MKINDARDRAALFVRAVKEQSVHQGKEMHFFVSCWRGGEPVALLAVVGGRDEVVNAAHVAAVGFGSDVIALSSDNVTATQPYHPETGELWEPGQISQYARAHPEKAKEYIREALFTFVVNRAGDTAHVAQPYRTFASPLIKGRTEIEWLEWEMPEGDIELGGYLPDTLREVMNEPTIDVVLARNGVPVGQTPQWRDHTDLATVKSAGEQLGDSVQFLLLAEAGTDRQRLLSARLGPGVVVEPPDLGQD